jgi:hypothetical protein
MRVGVVLLYGLFSPERQDYKGYLDFIAREENDKKLDNVILCGGFTDPKRPKESEASTAEKYLLSINAKFNNYILEDKSITTNQNLEYAKTKLNESDKIIVYCDLIRLAKVIWIATHFLLGTPQKEIYEELLKFAYGKNLYKSFEYRNITVVGYDFPGKSKEEMIGQTFATLIDVMALYDNELDELDVEYRKKDFGLS